MASPLLRVLPLAVFLAACAPGTTPPEPPAPPPFSPAGAWAAMADAQGQQVPVSIRISGAEGSWGGVIEADPSVGLPPAPITSLTIDGTTVTLRGDTMGQLLTMRLVFEGDRFSGSWSLADLGGAISGGRAP